MVADRGPLTLCQRCRLVAITMRGLTKSQERDTLLRCTAVRWSQMSIQNLRKFLTTFFAGSCFPILRASSDATSAVAQRGTCPRRWPSKSSHRRRREPKLMNPVHRLRVYPHRETAAALEPNARAGMKLFLLCAPLCDVVEVQCVNAASFQCTHPGPNLGYDRGAPCARHSWPGY